MATISVRWADDHLKLFGSRIDRLNQRFPKVIAREINKVGNRAKTQVIRNLTNQTGLPRKTIVKAVGDPGTAKPGKQSYEMVSRYSRTGDKPSPLEYLPKTRLERSNGSTVFPAPGIHADMLVGARLQYDRPLPELNGHWLVLLRKASDARYSPNNALRNPRCYTYPAEEFV